jgi:hypothetical protein
MCVLCARARNGKERVGWGDLLVRERLREREAEPGRSLLSLGGDSSSSEEGDGGGGGGGGGGS